MTLPSRVKRALKRGALVAAANWPVVVVQAVADSLFKVLIAVPLIGGAILVALVVGAEPVALMSLSWRDLTATIVAALLSRPLVLAAFLAALGLVVIGGSFLVFLIKGGTIGILVRGDQIAGPIERPPLRAATVARAAAFDIERFVEAAQRLFPRYARLGALLIATYLASGAAYLAFVLADRDAGSGWGLTAAVTSTFVAWITLVNLTYLLLQIIVAAEDCSVADAAGRLGAFARRERRSLALVFAVVLGLIVFATGAALLATAALSLIAFVPLVGLTVWPLHLVGWLFRALVFQYIGLASVGAYLNLYRPAAESDQQLTHVPFPRQPYGPHNAA